jgi:hypothetical protein
MQVPERTIALTTTSALCHAMRGAFLMLVLSTPALCQTTVPPVAQTVNLSGPRFGATFLSDGIVKKLQTGSNLTVGPVITQFGWQFEKQFYASEHGPRAVTECVLLLGGLEQGVVLPSLNWLVGIRTTKGAEFGVGPNVTPVGVALALAAGVTFRAGVLNVPVNLAVVPSKSGVRVSLLSGFSMRRR